MRTPTSQALALPPTAISVGCTGLVSSNRRRALSSDLGRDLSELGGDLGDDGPTRALAQHIGVPACEPATEYTMVITLPADDDVDGKKAALNDFIKEQRGAACQQYTYNDQMDVGMVVSWEGGMC